VPTITPAAELDAWLDESVDGPVNFDAVAGVDSAVAVGFLQTFL
jgi:hypothetical protein